jgi:hypothetical protein
MRGRTVSEHAERGRARPRTPISSRPLIVTLLMSALVCSQPADLRSQPQANSPVRLVVQVDKPTITVGETVNATIRLKGVSNQSSRAQKNYQVYVEVRDRDRPFWNKSVQLKTGSDSQRVPITIDRVGVVMIKALHSELREGATFVNVRPKPRLAMERRAGSGGGRVLAVAWEPRMAAITAVDDMEVTIHSSDEGSKLAADGIEAASIHVFLTSGAAPFDIRLQFFSGNRSELNPNPLVIPRGDGHGEASLTSKNPGQADISFVSVAPAAVKVSPWKKSVTFLRPIKTAIVHPVYPVRSLIDPPEEVWIELVGMDDKPMQPDRDVDVRLEVSTANGEIQPSSVKFTPADSRKSALFTPKRRGQALITATPFGATTSEPVPITVEMPWAALMAIMAGGFLGGLGAVFGTRVKGYRPVVFRGLLGVLAALIFFWAIQSGIARISSSVVGTTLFAFLASLPAGYMGTKAIDFVWGLVSKVPVGAAIAVRTKR